MKNELEIRQQLDDVQRETTAKRVGLFLFYMCFTQTRGVFYLPLQIPCV